MAQGKGFTFTESLKGRIVVLTEFPSEVANCDRRINNFSVLRVFGQKMTKAPIIVNQGSKSGNHIDIWRHF